MTDHSRATTSASRPASPTAHHPPHRPRRRGQDSPVAPRRLAPPKVNIAPDSRFRFDPDRTTSSPRLPIAPWDAARRQGPPRNPDGDITLTIPPAHKAARNSCIKNRGLPIKPPYRPTRRPLRRTQNRHPQDAHRRIPPPGNPSATPRPRSTPRNP